MLKEKRKWGANKIETNPNSYKEFIEISLSLGQSLEGIGKRINLSYDKILTYCQEAGLLNKYKNRSWTHKMKKQRSKKYRHLGKAKSKIPEATE